MLNYNLEILEEVEHLYAIVDIETSGGDPRKDRITEIAIFIHNGRRVIEQYCTLVNPKQYISPFITALTGISNEMVAEAPEWEEVADKVLELTKGRIFVAHNVRFDYNFIANEYRRMGTRWQRRNLCTVRLSRAIMPGLPSYSLGKLCDAVGIPVANRHRAFGDGAATAELFQMLLQHDKESVIKSALAEELKQSLLPPSINKADVENLPEETGVYYFKDVKGKIIYVGKSNNIQQRIISHFSGDMNDPKYFDLKQQIDSIDYEVTGNELVALIKESHEIKRWMPIYNKAQRRTKRHKYGLFLTDETPDGSFYISVKLLNEVEVPSMSVGSRYTAQMVIYGLTGKAELCKLRVDKAVEIPKYEQNVEPCICGICTGELSISEYNTKLYKTLNKYAFDVPDFIIIADGRMPQEKAIICIEDAKFKGYGYVDLESEQITDYDELKSRIQHFPHHADQQRIIKSYISKHKKLVELKYPNIVIDDY
ncbi:MAG: exonuclease domain-containing protein [Bacteroidota bacterium]|nr:exonuclease domain-containing protein [Bacteroidota bacterium]